MKIKNPINSARFLYLYVIFGGIAMFTYGTVSVIMKLPFWPTFVPVLLIVAYFLWIFIKKNIRSLWMFVSDVNQGRLHLALNERTHFSEKNKERLVQWVYPKRNQVRNETWLKLGEKVRTGQELTKKEKQQAKKKVVVCPQQILDGVNKAILVYVLIYAHKNICVLDDEVREILELTDENMSKFNLQLEIDKCRTQEYKKDYERRLEIGRKAMEESKN